MTSFSEREKAFEAKYKNDQELQFKVMNRRNKLLGLWAAQLMGLDGPAAELYAKEVVAADFEKPGDDDVVEKVMADFGARGSDVTEHKLRRRMEELHAEAITQIQSEMS